MRNAKPIGDYLKKKTLKGLDLLPPPKGSWTLILGQALKRCLFVCLFTVSGGYSDLVWVYIKHIFEVC